MTRKESEYINRLHDRRRILETRLARTPNAANFRADIEKELNALKWAIEKLESLV